MQEIETLRLYIRETLRNIKKQQKQELRNELNEERNLRKTVRKLLREKEDTTQYNSTGLNALDELMGSIVPIIRTGYKALRTAEEQRESFEAHILRGIQNLLSTASVYFSADEKLSQNKPVKQQKQSALLATPDGELSEQDEQGQEATPAMASAAPAPDAAKEKPDPLQAFQPVEGEDATGRNYALETFKKIQKQILEKYSLLSNEQDREMFYDYLITNTKLYFDKFEDELKITPAVPTTPEYEAEKAKKDAAIQGAGAPTGATVPEPAAQQVSPQQAPEEEPAA